MNYYKMKFGLGKGLNIFIVKNVCERIVSKAISPKALYVAFVHLLFVNQDACSLQSNV